MLFNLTLPRINDDMASTLVAAIHAPEGTQLSVGGKLADLMLTIGGTEAYDCPPISHFRLSARDRVWVRKWFVAKGDEPEVGTQIALFSTEPDEPLDAQPARQIRLTIAGIIPDFSFGSE